MTKELYLNFRNQLKFHYQFQSLLIHLIMDALLLTGTVFFLKSEGAMSFTASVLIAVLMLRNVSLMHEAVHGLAHPNRRVNTFFGLISGSLCLLPFQLWKKIHLEHHFWSGNYTKDPSLEIIKRYPKLSHFQQGLLQLSWKTRVPLMAFSQYLVFWFHSTASLWKNRRDPILWLHLLVPGLMWSATLMNLNSHQFLVFSTGILVYLVLFEVINFPHHVGLYLEESETAKLPVWRQHEVTRSSRYPSFIEKHLILNFNYHAEHHMFPDLPWHQLPKAHALLQESLARSETTVVQGAWLRAKRQEPFAKFLRPDLETKNQNRKAS